MISHDYTGTMCGEYGRKLPVDSACRLDSNVNKDWKKATRRVGALAASSLHHLLSSLLTPTTSKLSYVPKSLGPIRTQVLKTG